jgi:predicted RecA/RadA family phage recombinase
MAKNTYYMWSESLPLVCTDPATPASGDPVLCGQIPGVALAAEDAAGVTACAINGVFNLSVKGVDSAGNSAVAAGDAIYYQTGDTPKLSKKATNGVLFGYALGAVTSAATATIPVEVGK